VRAELDASRCGEQGSKETHKDNIKMKITPWDKILQKVRGIRRGIQNVMGVKLLWSRLRSRKRDLCEG